MIKYFSLLTLLISTSFGEQYIYRIHGSTKEIKQYAIDAFSGDLDLVSSYPQDLKPTQLKLSKDSNYLVVTFNDPNDKLKPYIIRTFKVDEKGKLKDIGENRTAFANTGEITKNGKYFIQYFYKPNKVVILEMNNHVFTGNTTLTFTTTNHPHDIGLSLDQNLLIVPHNIDNRLYQFSFDQNTGVLKALDPPYLKGPNLEEQGFANFRSLAIHPIYKVVYCSFEKHGGIASLKYDSKGLKAWQEFPSRPLSTIATPSKVCLSPDHKFLFVTNRHPKTSTLEGNSSIAVFKLNPNTGEIVNRVGIYPSTIKGPREILTDKSGKFLYLSTTKENIIVSHKINNDGSLTQLKEMALGRGSIVIVERPTQQ